jgi:hypothetical protein
MGLRRVPRLWRVISIGFRPCMEATCTTQAGDHEHDHRHGTSDPRHSEFLSLSWEAAARLKDWRRESANRSAQRPKATAGLRRVESPSWRTSPSCRPLAVVRSHPDRVRSKAAVEESLVSPAAWTLAVPEAARWNPNLAHRLLADSPRPHLAPAVQYKFQASSNCPGRTRAWGSRRTRRSARWSSGQHARERSYIPPPRCQMLRPSPHYEALP